MDYTHIIEGKIIASSKPINEIHLEIMKRLGVKAVLNLLTPEEKTIPDDMYKMNGFDYLNIPIPDMHPPTIDEIEKAVTWIDEKIKNGKTVLVHCYAGLGRTGTIIASYLVYKGYDPEKAIKYIREKRPGSIQTLEQELSIKLFYQKLKRRNLVYK